MNSKIEQPPDCDCIACREMCSRPCGPSPDEARVLIGNGYANNLEVSDGCLTLGREVSDWKYIRILAIRKIGFYNTICIFFNGHNCKIHSIKPLEGKMASHTGANFDREVDLYPLWDTEEAQLLIDGWRLQTNDV